MWPGIVVVAVIVAGALWYGMQKGNKLRSEGKIINRKFDFYEEGKEFTLTLDNPDLLVQRLEAVPYSEMKLSMKSDSQRHFFSFVSANFEAQLWRKSADSEKSVYCFQFNNWKTYNGIALGGAEMNMLLTSIEKLFLSIDRNTQVRAWELETKTKHSFF